jgi:hypothetical protein
MFVNSSGVKQLRGQFTTFNTGQLKGQCFEKRKGKTPEDIGGQVFILDSFIVILFVKYQDLTPLVFFIPLVSTPLIMDRLRHR